MQDLPMHPAQAERIHPFIEFFARRGLSRIGLPSPLCYGRRRPKVLEKGEKTARLNAAHFFLSRRELPVLSGAVVPCWKIDSSAAGGESRAAFYGLLLRCFSLFAIRFSGNRFPFAKLFEGEFPVFVGVQFFKILPGVGRRLGPFGFPALFRGRCAR